MRRRSSQAGFTLVELIITMCIGAVLTSIAITQMRDYTRRARISEVVMAANQCKNVVSESYPVRDSAPEAGGWGCEGAGGATKYAGSVETSSNGVIRIKIVDLDQGMNGRFIHLVPARSDGETPLTTINDLGTGVRAWICGSDWPLARNALPANCRYDTTTYASDEFH